MSRRISIFGASFASVPVWQAETIAYMNAVGIPADATVYYPATAYEVTGLQMWTAVNTFIESAITAGWWSKMRALYLMLGGISSTIKYNAVNPLDTDAAFRMQFFGGMSFGATGITGNAINSYANCFIRPSDLSQNGIGVTMYQRNAVVDSNAIDKWFISGSGGSSVNGLDGVVANEMWFFSNAGSGGNPRINIGNFQGIFSVNRTSFNDFRAYKNGVQIGSRTNASNTPTTNPFLLMQLGPILFGYGTVNANLCRVAIHDGMTHSDIISFHSALAQLNSSLYV